MVKTLLSTAAFAMLLTAGAYAQDTATTSQKTTAATSEGSTFTTVAPAEKLSSAVVGLSVYNSKNDNIGTIKDIAFGRTGVQAYILGVGGVLGMGDHYVAVTPSALDITWDKNSKAWHATLDTTSDQLKSAPAFTYPSQS